MLTTDTTSKNLLAKVDKYLESRFKASSERYVEYKLREDEAMYKSYEEDMMVLSFLMKVSKAYLPLVEPFVHQEESCPQ